MGIRVDYLSDLISADDLHQHVFMVEATHSGERASTLLLQIHEIERWCEENFGMPDRDRWDCLPAYWIFSFANDDDAFAFRLRWC